MKLMTPKTIVGRHPHNDDLPEEFFVHTKYYGVHLLCSGTRFYTESGHQVECSIKPLDGAIFSLSFNYYSKIELLRRLHVGRIIPGTGDVKLFDVYMPSLTLRERNEVMRSHENEYRVQCRAYYRSWHAQSSSYCNYDAATLTHSDDLFVIGDCIENVSGRLRDRATKRGAERTNYVPWRSVPVLVSSISGCNSTRPKLRLQVHSAMKYSYVEVTDQELVRTINSDHNILRGKEITVSCLGLTPSGRLVSPRIIDCLGKKYDAS